MPRDGHLSHHKYLKLSHWYVTQCTTDIRDTFSTDIMAGSESVSFN